MGSRIVLARRAAALALVAAGACAQVLSPATAWSTLPPEVVTDVSRSLGIKLSTATLDSIHFALPLLLVGTDTNSMGESYVFLVRPADLAILDTVSTLRSRVVVVTAGHVDTDSSVDYLVATDSMVTLVIGVPGATPATYRTEVTFPSRPYDSPSATAMTTGIIRDLAIDDSSGAFWVAYYTDVTYNHFGPLDYVRASKGGLRYFESPTADGVDLISPAAVLDVAFASDAMGAQPLMVAFWYSIYDEELRMNEAEPRYRYFGYRASSDSLIYDTLAGISRPGGGVGLSATVPDRMVDFSGTGLSGFVYSYASYAFSVYAPRFEQQETAAWVVATRSKLWTLQLYGTPRVWELDGDHLPDVLLFGKSETVGIKGNTGAELFSVPGGDIPFPVASGTLLQEGMQHGVVFHGDTLEIFHFALNASDVQSPVLPEGFSLVNVPNPFNTSTDILYSLGYAATTRLQIFDVLGRRVRLLRQAHDPAGQYRVSWNGTNDQGQSVGSGIYFYQLLVDDNAVDRKMLLLR